MKVVVIDGNNLAFRIYSSFSEKGQPLTNSVGMPTTVIYGLLRSIDTFVKSREVDKMIVAWDVGGGNQWRRTIWPLYKKNRKYKDLGDYFKELDATRDYLEVLGIKQAAITGIEADDVVGWLANKFAAEGHSVIIYSDDKDYYQLLNSQVKIYRPCKDMIYSLRSFYAEHSMKPKQSILIDALCGQEGDFIPGACDVDQKKMKLKKFRFGAVKAIAALSDAGFKLKVLKERLIAKQTPISEQYRLQLLKNWKQVVKSKKLLRIRTQNEEYSADDLKRLEEMFNQVNMSDKVEVSNVVALVRNLELRTVDVVPILRKIGVNINRTAHTSTKIKV
jgi:DNA polymerase-1